MTEERRPRVPVKPGFFTVPEDPNEAPKIIGTKCNKCGEHYFPSRAICARAECLSEDTSDVLMGPRGTLFSYTFVHMPLFGSSNLEHMDGYGVGQVDLPEGPRVQLPLFGKKDDFKIGMTLEAELDKMREEGGTDVVIVRFRPVEAGK
jgi:uncharacterized OB-fold protein